MNMKILYKWGKNLIILHYKLLIKRQSKILKKWIKIKFKENI